MTRARAAAKRLAAIALPLSISVTTFVIVNSERVFADPPAAHSRLFSARDSGMGSKNFTTVRMGSSRSRAPSQSRAARLSGGSQERFISESAFELTSDSEEVVQSQKQDSLSVSYYRNLQNLRFASDNPAAVKFEELDSESLGQHMGLFFSTKSFIDLIRHSNLGTIYRDVSSRIKQAGNYAAVSAGRNTAGEVELNHGESKRGRLFDFRLGVSTRNGIEPRLKLPQDLSVKYDINSGTTLLEYEINF